MKIKHYSPTAAVYARSLIELATESGQADAIGGELTEVAAAFEDTPSLKLFVVDPSIGVSQRAEVLKKGFSAKISPLLLNFLGVLNAKGRFSFISEIAAAYADLLEQQKGIVEVDVTVAQALSPDELNTVRDRISKALSKTAIVHQRVDESIIGGLQLQVQDTLIDASVKQQLATIRQQMLAARPR